MATNEKKLAENEEVEVIETTETTVEDNVTEEKKTSKFRAWISRHSVGLKRAAKAAALIGGGLVAGILISNKKKSKDEDTLMLDCGEWDDDFDGDELPDEDESVEETPTEESNEG